MPLARIILKSHTGVSLHDRFTRFMKQRGAEEAKSEEQKIHRQLPMGKTQPIRGSSDKNRRLALEMERRLERNNVPARSTDRSRSPRRERAARETRSREEPTSVRDRIGRRSVKDRIEMPAIRTSMSDRLGSRPISERVDQTSVGRNMAQYAKEQAQPKRSRQSSPRKPHKTESKQNVPKRDGAFREKRDVPDLSSLDKEMDDYMKKSKHGLDSMLDDYMKAGAKKKDEPVTDVAAVPETAQPEEPTATTEPVATEAS